MKGLGLLRTIAWILCIILLVKTTTTTTTPTTSTTSTTITSTTTTNIIPTNRSTTRTRINTTRSRNIEYTKETWTLEGTTSESYTDLIASLRAGVAVNEFCNIQVTTDSPLSTREFILVEIISLTNKTITVAFRASNVSYVGFMDELDGVTRANFIKEDFNELKDSHVFSDAKIKSQLPHGGSYDDLEEVAELYRRELGLGVSILSYIMDIIYGSDYESNDKPVDIELDLAKFALVAIQMTAEAARFRYTEDKVRDLGLEEEYFLPDGIFISLQEDWAMISELIFSSNDAFDCEASVKVADYPWDDIKPIMGLLRYEDDHDDDLVLKGLDDAPASKPFWRVF